MLLVCVIDSLSGYVFYGRGWLHASVQINGHGVGRTSLKRLYDWTVLWFRSMSLSISADFASLPIYGPQENRPNAMPLQPNRHNTLPVRFPQHPRLLPEVILQYYPSVLQYLLQRNTLLFPGILVGLQLQPTQVVVC